MRRITKVRQAHPNATMATGTTAVATLVVWLAGAAGLDLSAEAGAIIAGGASALVLFIGREGIKGAVRRVWRGSDSS